LNGLIKIITINLFDVQALIHRSLFSSEILIDDYLHQNTYIVLSDTDIFVNSKAATVLLNNFLGNDFINSNVLFMKSSAHVSCIFDEEKIAAIFGKFGIYPYIE
jgi:hypothetical protein